MRLLLTVTLFAGCVHRGDLRLPGPTSSMGWQPPSYVESLVQSEAVVEEDEVRPHRRTPAPDQGLEVARAAASFVGARRLVVHGERYRWDCSGFVMAAYAEAGITISGSSRDLYELARAQGVLHKKKRPQPGDVVFFDNTYDRNRNGRRDDELTHVALVESVADDGTIRVVHLGSKGVVRIAMNLKHADEHTDANGETINSYLRASRGRDGGAVLSGELWRAFGGLWAVDDEDVAAR